MTTINFGQLVDEAAANGFVTEVLPDNDYVVEVADRNAGESQNGKPQIGVQFRVLEGPHAGKRFWENITLTQPTEGMTDEQKSKATKALGMFIRKLGQLGVSSDFLKSQTSMDAVASAIVVGQQYTATLGQRTFNNKKYQDLKKLVAVSAPVQAPVSQPIVAPQPSNGAVPAASAPPF